MTNPSQQKDKLGLKEEWAGHVTHFLKIWNPLLCLEWMKLDTSKLVCRWMDCHKY